MWLALMLAAKICTAQDVAATETALNGFRVPDMPDAAAWAGFKKLVDMHGNCTDGVLGELWDEVVTNTLRRRDSRPRCRAPRAGACEALRSARF